MKGFRDVIYVLSIAVTSVLYIETRFQTKVSARERIAQEERGIDRLVEAIGKLDQRLYEIHKDLTKGD